MGDNHSFQNKRHIFYTERFEIHSERLQAIQNDLKIIQNVLYQNCIPLPYYEYAFDAIEDSHFSKFKVTKNVNVVLLGRNRIGCLK